MTVLVLDPKTIDDMLAAITLVGKVTGAKKRRLRHLLQTCERRIKAVTDKTAGLTPAQKTIDLFTSSGTTR